MRASATFSALCLGILALLLVSCSVDPHIRTDSKDELAKLKGPDPGSIDGELYGQAQQAMEKGDFKRASEIYKQLTDKSPDNMQYQLGFAESLRRMGNFPASLTITDAILKKNADNPDALENKALCLMGTGEFSESGEVFGKVMKIDPKRWRTLNGIGILFAMKGKYDPAVEYFQQALNVSTDNTSVLNNAALTYAIDRQFDRSYEAFERAKRHVTPGSAEEKHLDLNLALVYAVDGKLDDAERIASPHLSKEGLYNNMGFYSYLAKNNELAKGYLNMALTQSPTYYERAWKNLSALTGDTSAPTNGQAMPDIVMPLPATSQSLPPLVKDSVPSDNAPAAGIPLDDIPESKGGVHTVDTPPKPVITPEPQANAAPSSHVHVQDVPAKSPAPVLHAPQPSPAASTATAKTQEDTRKAADTDADTPPPASVLVQQPLTDISSMKTDALPAPVKDKEAPAKTADKDINPDIVLLHKPVPDQNSDWDAPPDKTGTPPVGAPSVATQ